LIDTEIPASPLVVLNVQNESLPPIDVAFPFTGPPANLEASSSVNRQWFAGSVALLPDLGGDVEPSVAPDPEAFPATFDAPSALDELEGDADFVELLQAARANPPIRTRTTIT
jgi:hypothetical protein